ncbi:hypothetical protein, partial [Streptomyces sp. AK02-04a]|uniref:hypothetical protein n=1 Tax=Streptomyces sp. AK02-04a TaxID=3028649 RepID=UPI0029AC5C1D
MSGRHKKVRKNSITVANRYAAVALSLGVALGIGAASAAPVMAAVQENAGSPSLSLPPAVSLTVPSGQISSTPVVGENVITNNSKNAMLIYSADSLSRKEAEIVHSLINTGVGIVANKVGGAWEKVGTVFYNSLRDTVAEYERLSEKNSPVVLLPGQSAIVRTTSELGQMVSTGGASEKMKSVKLAALTLNGKDEYKGVEFDTSMSSSYVADDNGLTAADATDRLKAAQGPGTEKYKWEARGPQTKEPYVDQLADKVTGPAVKALKEHGGELLGPVQEGPATREIEQNIKDIGDMANKANIAIHENKIKNDTNDPIFVVGEDSQFAKNVNFAARLGMRIVGTLTDLAPFIPGGQPVGAIGTVAGIGKTAFNGAGAIADAFRRAGVQVIDPHTTQTIDDTRLSDFVPKKVAGTVADEVGYQPSRSYTLMRASGGKAEQVKIDDAFRGDTLIAQDRGVFFAKTDADGNPAGVDPTRVDFQGHRWSGYDSKKALNDAKEVLSRYGYTAERADREIADLAREKGRSPEMVALAVIEKDSLRQVASALPFKQFDPELLNQRLNKALESIQDAHPELSREEAVERIIQDVPTRYNNLSPEATTRVRDSLRKDAMAALHSAGTKLAPLDAGVLVKLPPLRHTDVLAEAARDTAQSQQKPLAEKEPNSKESKANKGDAHKAKDEPLAGDASAADKAFEKANRPVGESGTGDR